MVRSRVAFEFVVAFGCILAWSHAAAAATEQEWHEASPTAPRASHFVEQADIALRTARDGLASLSLRFAAQPAAPSARSEPSDSSQRFLASAVLYNLRLAARSYDDALAHGSGSIAARDPSVDAALGAVRVGTRTLAEAMRDGAPDDAHWRALLPDMITKVDDALRRLDALMLARSSVNDRADRATRGEVPQRGARSERPATSRRRGVEARDRSGVDPR
jgi:hypothetical protein